MEVTDVRIRKLHQKDEIGNRMRAIVSVTFDNEFVVHDIKVIEGEQRHFIAMPSRKVEDGTYKDITHPIKSGLRTRMQEAVLARYEQALAEYAAAAALTGSDEDGGESPENAPAE